jgi:hypothetical protein
MQIAEELIKPASRAWPDSVKDIEIIRRRIAERINARVWRNVTLPITQQLNSDLPSLLRTQLRRLPL